MAGGSGAVRDDVFYRKISDGEDPGFNDHCGDRRADIREGPDQEQAWTA